jgi:hypothetical protein
MQKRAGKEIAQTRLLAQVAMGQGGEDKAWARNVNNTWTDYLRSTYYLEIEKENTEAAMMLEYNRFKHLKPEVKIDKTGALSVTGIPTEIL